MNTIEEQVHTLENKVRRQQRWNIALGGLVLVGCMLAATTADDVPDVIKARKFEVIGSSGAVLVEMDVITHQEKEFGGIRTLNSQAGIITKLGVQGKGDGNFTTYNSGNIPTIQLATTRGGDGYIGTLNSTGEKLVEITTASPTGSAW
ncbi:MAG: hypothetical protein VXX86_07485, partial [Planctomycetota bacterium]|nr:hypothetical protein [Planctomycetota bacterium]